MQSCTQRKEETIGDYSHVTAPSGAHQFSLCDLVTGRPLHLGISPLIFHLPTCKNGRILQGTHVLSLIINRLKLPSHNIFLHSLGLLMILNQESLCTGREGRVCVLGKKTTLKLHWKRLYLVLLTVPAVKLQGVHPWVHVSQLKKQFRIPQS